jgi:hypothetical protein
VNGAIPCNCDQSSDPPTGHRPWCGLMPADPTPADYETKIREALDECHIPFFIVAAPEVRQAVAELAAKAVRPLVEAEVAAALEAAAQRVETGIPAAPCGWALQENKAMCPCLHCALFRLRAAAARLVREEPTR